MTTEEYPWDTSQYPDSPYEDTWEDDVHLKIVRIESIEKKNSFYSSTTKNSNSLNTTFQTVDDSYSTTTSDDYFLDEQQLKDDSLYLKEIMRSSSELDETTSVDDIVEIGKVDKTKRRNDKRVKKSIESLKRRQKRRQRIRRLKVWISTHRWETICIAIFLLGLAIILGSILAYLKIQDANRVENSGDESSSSQLGGDSFWILSPTTSPQSKLTDKPTVPSSTETPSVAPVINPGAPMYSSLKERLLDAFGQDYEASLTDSITPQGMAYEWIRDHDELRWDHNHPLLVQRFVLAVFYFSTGGRRTTNEAWTVCSAVPNNTTETRNAFETRCVTENGNTICASFDAFENCSEYYERFDLDRPKVVKKRWLSKTSECDWYGIYCDQEGHVTQISIAKNGLYGTLTGELSSLKALGTINLSDNDLFGELPSWFGLDLAHLSLSHNDLEGTIPIDWRRWKGLETLDLAHNSVSGFLQLPNQWTLLKMLMLGGPKNSLDIELHSDIGSLSDLTTLDLNGNTIDRIPDSIGLLELLVEVNFANCGLVGTFPSALTSLHKLVELELQGNELTGTLPDGLWNLTEIEILRLENNQLEGTLSTQIGNLTFLQDLRLSRNQFDGTIPSQLENLFILERLHVEFNQFTEKVPSGLCDVDTLKELQADCDGNGKDVVECLCCSQCCNSKKDKCKGG